MFSEIIVWIHYDCCRTAKKNLLSICVHVFSILCSWIENQPNAIAKNKLLYYSTWDDSLEKIEPDHRLSQSKTTFTLKYSRDSRSARCRLRKAIGQPIRSINIVALFRSQRMRLVVTSFTLLSDNCNFQKYILIILNMRSLLYLADKTAI